MADPPAWGVEHVLHFFRTLGVAQYCDSIRANGVDGPMLDDLIRTDGLAKLNIVSKLHASKVRSRFRQAMSPTGPDSSRFSAVALADSSGLSSTDSGGRKTFLGREQQVLGQSRPRPRPRPHPHPLIFMMMFRRHGGGEWRVITSRSCRLCLAVHSRTQSNVV